MKITVPVRTESTLNKREHWSKRSRRAKLHRETAFYVLHQKLGTVQAKQAQEYTVTLTRVAPRPLDGDNLQGSLKSVRDGVADWLGIDDGSARVQWKYDQRRGEPKTYSVEVEVQA